MGRSTFVFANGSDMTETPARRSFSSLSFVRKYGFTMSRSAITVSYPSEWSRRA